MKRISFAVVSALMLVGTPAFAADMALKAPPPPPAPIFSWTGFYIGGELGGAWANGHVNDSLYGLNGSSNHDGWLGGAVVGYNYQTSNVVFGIEADFDGTSLKATGNGVFVPALASTLQASAKTDWITTVAGRVRSSTKS
jgi:outer membrane immunogenic protein